MRTRIRYVALGAVLLLAAGCGGSNGGSSAGDATGGEPIHLSVSTTLGGAGDYHVVPITEYLDAVEEASDGRITYDFHHANSIVPVTEIGQALADGVLDLAAWAPLLTPAAHPVDNWLSPLAFVRESGVPAAVMEKSAAGVEWWWSNADARRSDFEQKGLQPLTHGVSPIMFYDLICVEPVRNLEEARGKQVRTTGPSQAASAESIGMTPVTMPGTEVYEALQRGVVDCVMHGPSDFVQSNLWEVGKHYTQIGFGGTSGWGLHFSLATWESLDEEAKEIFWANLPVYWSNAIGLGMDLHHEFFTEGEEQGVEYHLPDDQFMDAVRTHQDSVLQEHRVEGPPEVGDPAAALDNFLELHEKWANIIQSELGYQSYDSWIEWAADTPDANQFDALPWAERLLEEVEQYRPE